MNLKSNNEDVNILVMLEKLVEISQVESDKQLSYFKEFLGQYDLKTNEIEKLLKIINKMKKKDIKRLLENLRPKVKKSTITKLTTAEEVIEYFKKDDKTIMKETELNDLKSIYKVLSKKDISPTNKKQDVIDAIRLNIRAIKRAEGFNNI